MMHRFLLPWLVLTLGGPWAYADFLAGAATVDITPPKGLPMWGYGARHAKPNEGVRDPLEANAVVLAVGEQRLAIVGLDLGRAPTRYSFGQIRARVKQAAKVDTLFLVASHTHHGPVLESGEVAGNPSTYNRALEDKLVEAIQTAAQRLRPAQLAVARKQVPLNRNRHSKLPTKPVDSDLVVLRLDDDHGAPIAILVNFAAHPTMLPASLMLYSADYPGALKRYVRKELGGECVFLQGAAGDLSTNPGPLRGETAFGEGLGREVVTLARPLAPRAPKGATLRVREEEFQFRHKRVDLDSPLVRRAFATAFFPALVEFYLKEYADGIRPRLTVAVLNDEIGLVGVSGEFFCSHSLRLKERARIPHLLFLGYCNDYQQYFPTIEAAAEGGYGADAGVSPVEIGAGEQIMNRALFYLYDLRGRYNRLPF